MERRQRGFKILSKEATPQKENRGRSNTYVILKSFSSGFNNPICLGVNEITVFKKFHSIWSQFIDFVGVNKGIPKQKKKNLVSDTDVVLTYEKK